MQRWLNSLPTPSSDSSNEATNVTELKSTAGFSGARSPLSSQDDGAISQGKPDQDAVDLQPNEIIADQPRVAASDPDNALRIPFRILNTGAKCPGIGYGTGGEGKATPDEVYQAIRVALDCGYRNFDLAPFYQDGLIEKTVGRAIRDSGIERSEIFVATKVWPTYSRRPEESLNMSLGNLGMDYVDCLLLHWPIPLRPVPGDPYAMGGSWDAGWDFKKTWAKMQEIPATKARSIGVCNFTVNRLRLLLASPTTTVVPAVLQVEGHPELPQASLMQFCREHGIQVFCFSPLAQGQVSNPTIRHVAESYNADSGQVAISWAIQRGTIPLPKSTNLTRICTNLSLVRLDTEAMKQLDRLGKRPRRIVNPRIFFGHDIFENNVDSYSADDVTAYAEEMADVSTAAPRKKRR